MHPVVVAMLHDTLRDGVAHARECRDFALVAVLTFTRSSRAGSVVSVTSIL